MGREPGREVREGNRPAAGMKMVPNRIRLSAVGRSRRLIVEARGFRGSAPISVFYFGWRKSILTDGARAGQRG